jgi:apolipoprotein N-acyltransferase
MSSALSASRPRDRLAWLWLAIGAALLPFAHIQTVWPVAAWLSPVFLMRFARTQRPALGLPLLLLAQVLATAFGLRNDFTTLPVGPLLAGVILAYSVLFSLPFVLDRALAGRLPGPLRTLVYPLAAVTLDYFLLHTPFYTYGSPAYTQYGDLPLMQLLSLTGMWGLTFLISWLAPAVNEVWERGTSWPVLRYSLLPFALVLAAVLVYGSARLTFMPYAPVVRVAALTPDRLLWRYLPVHDIAQSSPAERAALRTEMLAIVDDLLARSRGEAQAGAQVITWSETAAFILKEDEAAILEQARTVAREQGIYLQVGLMVIRQTAEFPYGENRAILFDPAGQLVWDYHKAFPVPVGDGFEIAPGPAIVPVTDTPYGRLAGVICYDMDVVPYMRQAGLARVGLVLAPADDWPAIERDHAAISVYRAVENGFALVRPTSKGISLAVDSLGRELGRGEYYTAERLTVVAAVPVQAVPTLYSRIGDIFAYGSIAVLVIITALGLLRRQRFTTPMPEGAH